MQNESLGEALPKEQARVREVLSHYIALGPPGQFGARMIEASLQAADRAVMDGDLMAMVAAYKDLQTIED